MFFYILNLVITLSVFVTTTAAAGNDSKKESYSITLSDALNRIRQSNYNVRQAYSELSIAKGQYNGTNSLFLPTIELSENFTNTNDPLNVFGFKLKQGITTANDFNPELLNNPESITNFNTRIDVNQPIINPDGFIQRSATKDYYKAAELGLERTIEFVEFQVKRQYAELWLSYKAIHSVELSLKSAKEALKLAKDNFEAGYLLEADVLAAEIYVLDLETKLEQSKNQYEHASDKLKYLIQLEQDQDLVPTEEPTVSLSNQTNDFDLGQRSDLQALSYRLSGSEKMLRASKFNYVPSLNAQFSYEWNDDNIFGTTADNYLLGVSLRWRIFDGYKSIASVQTQRAEFEKLNLEYEKKQAEANLEITRSIKNLEIAQKRKAIANKMVTRAEEIRTQTLDRYQQGLEKTSDLLEAEASLAQRQADYLSATYHVLVASYTLEFLKEQSIYE